MKLADKRRWLTVIPAAVSAYFFVSVVIAVYAVSEKFPAPRAVGKSESHKPYKCIICRELNKKFRSAAALIFGNLRMRLLIGNMPACLAASYAAALAALL